MCDFSARNASPRSRVDGHQIAIGLQETDCYSINQLSRRPELEHANLIGSIRAAFSKVSFCAGERQYPQYATSLIAKDMFDSWDIDCPRDMEFKRWEPRSGLPPGNPRNTNGPSRRVFRPVAARASGRARRRWPRGPVFPIFEAQGALAI